MDEKTNSKKTNARDDFISSLGTPFFIGVGFFVWTLLSLPDQTVMFVYVTSLFVFGISIGAACKEYESILPISIFLGILAVVGASLVRYYVYDRGFSAVLLVITLGNIPGIYAIAGGNRLLLDTVEMSAVSREKEKIHNKVFSIIDDQISNATSDLDCLKECIAELKIIERKYAYISSFADNENLRNNREREINEVLHKLPDYGEAACRAYGFDNCYNYLSKRIDDLSALKNDFAMIKTHSDLSVFKENLSIFIRSYDLEKERVLK